MDFTNFICNTMKMQKQTKNEQTTLFTRIYIDVAAQIRGHTTVKPRPRETVSERRMQTKGEDDK